MIIVYAYSGYKQMILLLSYIETSKIILSLWRMQFNIIVLTNRYPNSEPYKLQHATCYTCDRKKFTHHKRNK